MKPFLFGINTMFFFKNTPEKMSPDEKRVMWAEQKLIFDDLTVQILEASGGSRDPCVLWEQFKKIQRSPNPFILGDSYDCSKFIRWCFVEVSLEKNPKIWRSSDPKFRDLQKEKSRQNIEVLFEILEELLLRSPLEEYHRLQIMSEVLEQQSRLIGFHLLEEALEAGGDVSHTTDETNWEELQKLKTNKALADYDWEALFKNESLWVSALDQLLHRQPEDFRKWKILLEHVQSRQDALETSLTDLSHHYVWHKQTRNIKAVVAGLEALEKDHAIKNPPATPAFEEDRQTTYIDRRQRARELEQRFKSHKEALIETQFHSALNQVQPQEGEHNELLRWVVDLSTEAKGKLKQDERWWAILKARHDRGWALRTQIIQAKRVEEWPLNEKTNAKPSVRWGEWIREKEGAQQGLAVGSGFGMNEEWSRESLRRGLRFENLCYLTLWRSSEDKKATWKEWNHIGLSDIEITRMLIEQWRDHVRSQGKTESDVVKSSLSDRLSLKEIFPVELKDQWQGPLQEWLHQRATREVFRDLKRIEELEFLFPGESLDDKWIQWGQLFYHKSDLWNQEVQEYHRLRQVQKHAPLLWEEVQFNECKAALINEIRAMADKITQEGPQLNTQTAKTGLKIVWREILGAFPPALWMEALEDRPQCWELVFEESRHKNREGKLLTTRELLDHPWVWTFFTVDMNFGEDNSGLYRREDLENVSPEQMKQWLASLEKAGWGSQTLYMPPELWLVQIEDQSFRSSHHSPPNEAVYAAVRAQFTEEQLKREWGVGDEELGQSQDNPLSIAQVSSHETFADASAASPKKKPRL